MENVKPGNQNAHRTDWAWLKNETQMKDTQNEIKRNIQGTKSEGKETGTQSNDLEQKEEIYIQLEQNEETRTPPKWKEAEEYLGQPETFQYLNYRGGRRRRKTARIEKLFEEIMKENVPVSWRK